MSIIETRGTWTDLAPGVGLEMAEVFDQGQEEYIVGLTSVVNSSSEGGKAAKHFTGKTGVGRIEQFEDGDDIPGGRRYKTYTTDVAYVSYGKHLDVTKLSIEDREYTNELDEMKDLSMGANYSQDEAACQLFNGGFSTNSKINGYTVNLYGDGKATFSTQHPTVVPGASSQSNASATGAALTIDNLEIAKVALIEQRTDDGLAMALLGKPTIVVPPALEREAKEKVDSELTPESNLNAINVFRGTMDIVSSTFFAAVNGGSNTAWYVIVPGKHKLFHEVRQSPRLDMDTNIKNKIVTFTVDARWVEYVKDWRRTWGSRGDGAAYSG